MKTNTWKSMAVVCLCALVVAGCQSMGKRLSDEEMVDANMRLWAQGLVEHDMEKFQSVISENFSSPQAPDKKALADFILQAIDAGYLDDAEASFDDAKINIDKEAGVSSVYPVDLMSAAGSVSMELVFSKEDGNWLLTGMEVDGL